LSQKTAYYTDFWREQLF